VAISFSYNEEKGLVPRSNNLFSLSGALAGLLMVPNFFGDILLYKY